MKSDLDLAHTAGRHVDILAGGRLLWRYVYVSDAPANEAPRPYAHPVYSIDGDVLTNYRPNDHPWHHALSLTLASVDAVNFWGGPTYRAADGYQWRDDHGSQRHDGWVSLAPELLDERIDWNEGKTGSPLLRERRRLRTALVDGGWSLEWSSELSNATDRTLTLGNYHSLDGLSGSHYTGLQFRGARDLLDEHGDERIGIRAEGGLAGEAAVHGAVAGWMEWACQHDGSLRRTRIRFENRSGPLAWFCRAKNPVTAFAFQREHSHAFPPGVTLRLDHRLTFTRG